jgi:hypothetical protein
MALWPHAVPPHSGPTQYTITIVNSVDRLTGPSQQRSQLAGFRRQGMAHQSAGKAGRQIAPWVATGTVMGCH